MNDVANFPLLVRITGSTIVDAVQNSAPGHPLPWTGTGRPGSITRSKAGVGTRPWDSAEVWVLVPTVDGNSDHDFITLLL